MNIFQTNPNNKRIKQISKKIQHNIKCITDQRYSIKNLGFSMDQLLTQRLIAHDYLDEIADQMKKNFHQSKSLKIASGALGISSGAIGLLGVALAPLTGGLSLGLTATSGIVGLSSAFCGVANSVKENIVKKNLKEIQIQITSTQNKTKIFFDLIREIQKLLNELNDINLENQDKTAFQRIKSLIPTTDIERARWTGNLNSALGIFSTYRDKKSIAKARQNFSHAMQKALNGSSLIKQMDTAQFGVRHGPKLLAIEQIGMRSFSIAAKSLTGILGGLNIVTGAVDLQNGIKQIDDKRVLYKKNKEIQTYKEITKAMKIIADDMKENAQKEQTQFREKIFFIVFIIFMIMAALDILLKKKSIFR